MLSTRGIGILDDPLSPYVLARWNADARIVAQLAVCEALGDRVAWAAIVGDDSTRVVQDSKGRDVTVLRGGLLAYQVVYGNRKGKRRGPRRRP